MLCIVPSWHNLHIIIISNILILIISCSLSSSSREYVISCLHYITSAQRCCYHIWARAMISFDFISVLKCCSTSSDSRKQRRLQLTEVTLRRRRSLKHHPCVCHHGYGDRNQAKSYFRNDDLKQTRRGVAYTGGAGYGNTLGSHVWRDSTTLFDGVLDDDCDSEKTFMTVPRRTRQLWRARDFSETSEFFFACHWFPRQLKNFYRVLLCKKDRYWPLYFWDWCLLFLWVTV